MNFSNDGNKGKNLTGITIVIMLHVLLAYGIVTGLGKRMVVKMIEPVETKIIVEAKPTPPDQLPPPPAPAMKVPPPPFIPPVEIKVQQPPPVQNVIANTTAAKPVSNELVKALPAAGSSTGPSTGISTGPAKSVRIAAVADFNSCEKPVYPRMAQRNEETGTVTLSFLIGVDGRVIDSKVIKSSGFRDLDQAAQNGIGKCVFKPGSVDGKPEQAWLQMQYVWMLD